MLHGVFSERTMKFLTVLLLVIASFASGCGTLYQHIDPFGEPGPYSGVRADFQTMRNLWKGRASSESFEVCAHCDLPLSFVADTLFLPYDLTHPKPWLEPPPQKPVPMRPDPDTGIAASHSHSNASSASNNRIEQRN
jgi:uncharacterized protein YceK